MTHKSKIKELVGRSLNSYHTKSLQQIDRIEKKNKEQNHKISILSNELDNDYLTKTEEGSVVSLEHSKEGMVYLDELQGNTMVNYCTDGSKEMTLNGDIDVEGTFVTTTEGVDNGKVDVMCEGNTLVNLVKSYDGSNFYHLNSEKLENNYFKLLHSENENKSNVRVKYGNHLYKPSTKYTVIVDIKENTANVRLGISNTNSVISSLVNGVNFENKLGISTLTFETKDDFSTDNKGLSPSLDLYFCSWDKGGDLTNHITFRYMVLEGDWTDKEIPQYFEGMKSVGQDDENGHKIEILSQSNLANIATSGNTNFRVANVKAGVSYSIKSTRSDNTVRYNLLLHDIYGNRLGEIKGGISSDFCTFTPFKDGVLFFNAYKGNTLISDIMLVKGVYTEDTMPQFKPYTLNKKEILLNEPLRGLPNGTKDRKVKIGGKWYIERNCKGFSFNDNQVGTSFYIEEGKNVKGIICGGFNNKEDVHDKYQTICDKIPCRQLGFNEGGIGYFYENPANFMFMFSLDENLESARQKILSCKFVSKLKAPIYEPLEIEPTLNTYNDTTHISNNSIIPCNMKIQNSGYNAIIKPSTLYTIALDTNKPGTIGMNLGGVKGTTTNNVLKLTTPATLIDDSLRLYGKGIKGSKVRLLEGDKTNWIPSHFEGMQSSFEDKLQDDGTYKMEILSNNKNLFDITKVPNETTVENLGDCLRITGYANDLKVVASFLTPNKTYTTSTTLKEIQGTNNGLAGNIRLYNPKTGHWITSKTFIAPQNIKDYGIFLYGMQGNTSECIVSNIQIFEGNEVSLYTPHKSNKIQFSSIEPLRKTRDAWDKFVFIDGKLMIERNCIEFVFDGSEDEGWGNSYQRFNKYYVMRCIPSVKIKSSWDYRSRIKSSHFPSIGAYIYAEPNMDNYIKGISSDDNSIIMVGVPNYMFSNLNEGKEYLKNNPLRVVTERKEPIYEEIPFELQKIILEGYENGTLFFDTNIPPTSKITYAGETPIVKSVKLNKTEVLNNTNDINDNIIPYLMDMDYRVVCLQLQSEEFNGGVEMARLFGGTYEMLKRDILSKRYSVDEYRYRLDAYLDANKITEEEYNKLGDMLNE